MRRARFWIILVVVLVVVGGGALLLALPPLVRWAAVTGIRSATGRATTIASVEINLFTGRLVVAGLRVDERDGGPPLAELERLEARFRLLPVLRGQLHLDSLAFVAPRIRIVRLPSGQLSIADVLERFAKGEPSKEPANVVLRRLDLERGAVIFDDRAVTPAHTWEASGLTLAVRDIATRSPDPLGTSHPGRRPRHAGGTRDPREARSRQGRPHAGRTRAGAGVGLHHR